jgi:hypothetical protein
MLSLLGYVSTNLPQSEFRFSLAVTMNSSHLREDRCILYSGHVPEDGNRRFLRNVGVGLRDVTLHKRVSFLSRVSGREIQGGALAADFDNNFTNQSPGN